MQVAGFSILMTVVTGIAFGLAPAWFASRVSAITTTNSQHEQANNCLRKKKCGGKA
jgi:hypothetical protein